MKERGFISTILTIVVAVILLDYFLGTDILPRLGAPEARVIVDTVWDILRTGIERIFSSIPR